MSENKKFERVKLDYRPAVVSSPPVREIEVPSSELEKLNQSIKEKVSQNRDLANRARENMDDFIVR